MKDSNEGGEGGGEEVGEAMRTRKKRTETRANPPPFPPFPPVPPLPPPLPPCTLSPLSYESVKCCIQPLHIQVAAHTVPACSSTAPPSSLRDGDCECHVTVPRGEAKVGETGGEGGGEGCEGGGGRGRGAALIST